MHMTTQRLTAAAHRMLFLSALVVATSTAFAAEVPNYSIGDALKQAAPPPSPDRKETPAPVTPVIIREEEKPLSLAEGEKIFVKDFRIEGAVQGDAAELAALVAPYRNRELTMAEITETANTLTLFHRNKGYLVAKAYVPKQDARDGILTIRIVMGAYGRFTLKNSSPVPDALVRGVFDRTKNASSIVTKTGLERAILLVGDMPGSKPPTVTIAPGATPGTSDFEVAVAAAKRFGGYLMADNQGSRFSGKNRLYGGVDINSPLGLADRFSVSGMVTEDTVSEGSGLWNLRLAYGVPLASNGPRGEVAVARTKYELGGIYSDLGATGTADTVEGTLSYPIRKSGLESIDLSLNLAFKDLKDDQQAVGTRNPRNDVVGTVTLQRQVYSTPFGHNLFAVISGGVSVGSLDITDTAVAALNKAGADTEGIYSRFNLALSGNLELTENLSARASFKLQQVLSGNNLDSSEQFFITGISGVRAYSESVGFDNGTIANVELKYTLPTPYELKHSVSLFFDNGWAYAEKGNYTTNDIYILSDAGAGYNLNYKQMFCSLQVAQPVGKTEGVSDPGTRFLLQFGAAF